MPDVVETLESAAPQILLLTLIICPLFTYAIKRISADAMRDLGSSINSLVTILVFDGLAVGFGLVPLSQDGILAATILAMALANGTSGAAGFVKKQARNGLKPKPVVEPDKGRNPNRRPLMSGVGQPPRDDL